MTTKRFNDALVFANELHAPQKRKGTDIPYVSHLLAVSSLVMEHGGGEDEAIAALLHDAIEDRAKDYPGGLARLRADIEGRFGAQVLGIVEGCTDAVTHPKPDWETRKRRYIAKLPDATPSVRLVSCADKLHNARAIVNDQRALGDALFARFNAGKTGVLWYYRSLAESFSELGPRTLAAELTRTVDAMHELAGG